MKSLSKILRETDTQQARIWAYLSHIMAADRTSFIPLCESLLVDNDLNQHLYGHVRARDLPPDPTTLAARQAVAIMEYHSGQMQAAMNRFMPTRAVVPRRPRMTRTQLGMAAWNSRAVRNPEPIERDSDGAGPEAVD